MKSAITSTGGRASQAALEAMTAAFDHRKIRRGPAENLVGLVQLPVLPFKRLHPLGHVARNACAPATVALGLLDPRVQSVLRAADLRRNRRGRMSARPVLPRSVENHTDRALAHFRGKRVRGLAHHAPSYSEVGTAEKPGAGQTTSTRRLPMPRSKAEFCPWIGLNSMRGRATEATLPRSNDRAVTDMCRQDGLQMGDRPKAAIKSGAA